MASDEPFSAEFWARQVEKASGQADALREAIESALGLLRAGHGIPAIHLLERALLEDDDRMDVLTLVREVKA